MLHYANKMLHDVKKNICTRSCARACISLSLLLRTDTPPLVTCQFTGYTTNGPQCYALKLYDAGCQSKPVYKPYNAQRTMAMQADATGRLPHLVCALNTKATLYVIRCTVTHNARALFMCRPLMAVILRACSVESTSAAGRARALRRVRVPAACL